MPEHQTIEWKESWHNEYLEWICGYANANGGILYIGMDDHGRVKGIKDSKKLLEKIPSQVTDTMGICTFLTMTIISAEQLCLLSMTTLKNG